MPMDSLQTLTDSDFAWLAGIVDGEGSITAQVIVKSDQRVRITPFVHIGNTDQGIIGECVRVLTEAGIKHRIYAIPISDLGKLAGAQIRIDGKPVKKLLLLIQPYLRSVKRTYAEKVLQYMAMREVGLFQHNEAGRIRRREYSQAEVSLISEVRTHKAGRSREEIMAAPNVSKVN